MDAWGVGLFENDDGADIVGICDRFIVDYEISWRSYKIASYF